MAVPNFNNLKDNPKVRGADGYTSDVIDGIIKEEERKNKENKKKK